MTTRPGMMWKVMLSPLRVELDDEVLLDRSVDLLPAGKLVDEDLHRVGDDLEPRRYWPLAVGLARDDEGGCLPRLLADLDHIVLGHLGRRDVDLVTVDQEVAMYHKLPGMPPGPGQAGAID